MQLCISKSLILTLMVTLDLYIPRFRNGFTTVNCRSSRLAQLFGLYYVSSHLYNQAMLSNGVQNAKDPVSLKSRRADDSFLPDEFCAKYGGDVSFYIVYYQRLNPKILCSSLLETTCPSAALTPNPSLDHTPLR